MIEKLTKKKALEICIELWTWLAETGSEYKFDWPGWKEYGDIWAHCPCCEYQKQNPVSNCLIFSGINGKCTCTKEDSVYTKWNSAGTSTRKEYAQQIVDLAKQKLSEL